jgi:hypothetical protein
LDAHALSANTLVVQIHQILAIENDIATFGSRKLHDGASGRALSAAGFSDDAQGFPFGHVE